MSTEGPAAAYPGPDMRPVVRTSSAGNRSLWIFAAIIVVGALLLFRALTLHREQLAAPATQAAPSNGATITAPPPLSLPPRFGEAPEQQPLPAPQPALPAPAAPAPPPRVVTHVIERPAPVPSPPLATPPPLLPQPTVIEAPPAAAAASPPAKPAPAGERVFAEHLRNPSFTVPQGTIIPAVLETALDSTRPGGVRALVERDIMGFDGTRVLIPRGSRLYGEYGADLGAGQKRALIRWTRLTRPDAVIINLDSPAADPLGRAGVKGKVNSHFLERFGGAILQSVLNIGVGVATHSITDNGLFLALPGSAQSINPVQPQQVQRTLKVRQGTSVSVFVARDLDFSTVDR
jgi:type IV secretion system protein VirB10